ncbi:MAG: hypothetical protein ACFB50_13880, partial [Rubrobacteraceae bacterium]
APIFPDFWKILRGYAEHNELVSDLMEKLWSWHSGSLSKIFDAPTNVDLSNKYLVFKISKVKDRQKAPVMHAILEFLNGVLSNRNEPSDCWIDEGWALLSFKMSAEFTETMYRSGRARDNGMWIASQAVIEFVESHEGNVILDLAATHAIFRHEHQKSANATASIHDLSEEETEQLLSFQPGEGYLVVDQSRIPMEVLASEKEKELYNTDPRIEAENKKKRRKECLAERRVAEADEAGAADTRRKEKAAIPGMEALGYEGTAPVFAFAGEGAAETAAAVAKLLGRTARREGLDVLAVDACGGSLAELLSTNPARTGSEAESVAGNAPDSFLRRATADPDALGEHIKRTRFSALRVVHAPTNDSLPAVMLQEAAGEAFDLCVVACGDAEGRYAEDWLLAADKVVACSSNGPDDALDAAQWVEEKRDSNGTVLALIGARGVDRTPETTYPAPEPGHTAGENGEAGEAVEAPGEAFGEARKLYTLGPAAHSGTGADAGLSKLTRSLVAAEERDEHPEMAMAGAGADATADEASGPTADKEESYA